MSTFKIGERVVLYFGGSGQYGTVVDFDITQHYIRVLEDDTKNVRSWGIYYTIPAEIFNTPLFHAMREK